jgi:putative hemolysin
VTLEIIILLILIGLSAFFSGSEIAFISANKIKIEIKARKKNLPAESALYFLNNSQHFFSTILIGNNIVNVVFASISTLFLSALFGLNEFGILIVSSVMILFFGELIPKYFARELSERVVLISALPLRIVYFIFYPVVKVISSISVLLTQSTSLKAENVNYLFSKEDIELLVKESREAGIVDKKESDIISRVFALGDQKIYEAMRPRTEIIGIDIEQTINQALALFVDAGYSKMPVYEENLDNIKGIIYANDLFKFPKSIQEILKEAMFVPETKKSFELLNEFLSKRVSIAVVIDEFGGTAGIITMEDIIEELFGEIKDEFDVEEDICKKVDENTYLISGKVEIDYINEKYNLNIPAGDYETIGGYITSKLGRIPVLNENVVIDGFNVTIVRANQVKIELVRLIDKREIVS